MLQHDILHFLLSWGQTWRLGGENYVPVLCNAWMGANHSIPVSRQYTTRIEVGVRMRNMKIVLLVTLMSNYRFNIEVQGKNHECFRGFLQEKLVNKSSLSIAVSSFFTDGHNLTWVGGNLSMWWLNCYYQTFNIVQHQQSYLSQLLNWYYLYLDFWTIILMLVKSMHQILHIPKS